MDPHTKPFRGKTQASRKIITGSKPKTTPKESHISREKRLFGNVRSTNIPEKSTTTEEKQITKASKPKPTKKNTTEVAKKNSMEKTKSRLEEEIKNPVASPRLMKSELEETPYYSAKNWGKCRRFDKLETAAYWVDQIKLAESVGKHLVSVGFFRLALDSNAQPMRKLCFELKQYLQQHKHLCNQKEWNDASLAYGILKDTSDKDESSCVDFDQHKRENLNGQIIGAD